jgi:uncharacterized protein YidB (DUF937 family)
MGLLDQVLSGVGGGQRQAAPKPGVGGTIAAGVLLALAVKAVRSYDSRAEAQTTEGRSFDPPSGSAAAQPGGGLLGGLGGILGAGGVGGLLGSLGGSGALGGLISHLQQKGYGQQVNSWVQHGENQPLAPAQLAEALGDDTVQQLQDQTGMPRDALLTDLSRVLPQAVDEATPQGRPPSDTELHEIAATPAAPA